MGRSDYYAPLTEWRKAMEEALKRTGKRLFESGRGVMGGYYVNGDSAAWCCALYRVGAHKSQGPQKTKAHLRTANHFREWCIEHREQAIERFPEVKPFFAEYELTKVERQRPGVTSTTSTDLVRLAKGLLGKTIP